jgi:hypothetical protein
MKQRYMASEAQRAAEKAQQERDRERLEKAQILKSALFSNKM